MLIDNEKSILCCPKLNLRSSVKIESIAGLTLHF